MSVVVIELSVRYLNTGPEDRLPIGHILFAKTVNSTDDSLTDQSTFTMGCTHFCQLIMI